MYGTRYVTFGVKSFPHISTLLVLLVLVVLRSSTAGTGGTADTRNSYRARILPVLAVLAVLATRMHAFGRQKKRRARCLQNLHNCRLKVCHAGVHMYLGTCTFLKTRAQDPKVYLLRDQYSLHVGR